MAPRTQQITHGDSHRIFTSPSQTLFSQISLQNIFFLLSSQFSLLEPSKPPPRDKKDFNRFWKAPSNVIFPFQRTFPLLKIAPSPPHTGTHPILKVQVVLTDPDACPSLNGITIRASTKNSQRIPYSDGYPVFPHLYLPSRHMRFLRPPPFPHSLKQVQETNEPNCY